jgi:CDP-2,3-bis-(O-geranylgeranyl)-sn-glycerol synthase
MLGSVPTLFRVAQLVYFMAPAYAANMAPPFTRFWRGWNPPLSRRWLGNHKTVLGFIAGMLAAIATALIQARIAWDGGIVTNVGWFSLGIRFGFGTMAGDAVKSFFKRRRGIEPGRPWIPFDQLDFAAGALVLVGPSADLSVGDIVVILIVTLGADVVVNRVGYALGVRETPW